jgi:[acyl-carrier-protein] S-malonyltransferase
MEPARQELADAINDTEFNQPICPVYQNVKAQPVENADIIKINLIAQLTAPVLWTQSVKAMVDNGATQFVEIGPGKVLSGLVKKIAGTVETTNL